MMFGCLLFNSWHFIINFFLKIRRGKLGWFRDSSTTTLRSRTQGYTEEAGLSTVSYLKKTQYILLDTNFYVQPGTAPS